MKKTILTYLFILSLVFTACSNSVEIQSTKARPFVEHYTRFRPNLYYTSKDLGIIFQYRHGFEDKAVEQGNKIFYFDWSPTMYIAVFDKPEDQRIEESILDLVASKGGDPAKCKVISRGEFHPNEFALDLIDPEIIFSEEELKEIAEADIQAQEDGGPFNGDWKKRDIYNRRLVETCSELADPLGLGTSKSVPSFFIYDESQTKNKYVFIPATPDPYFHEEGSIKFIVE